VHRCAAKAQMQSAMSQCYLLLRRVHSTTRIGMPSEEEWLGCRTAPLVFQVDADPDTEGRQPAEFVLLGKRLRAREDRASPRRPGTSGSIEGRQFGRWYGAQGGTTEGRPVRTRRAQLDSVDHNQAFVSAAADGGHPWFGRCCAWATSGTVGKQRRCFKIPGTDTCRTRPPPSPICSPA